MYDKKTSDKITETGKKIIRDIIGVYTQYETWNWRDSKIIKIF